MLVQSKLENLYKMHSKRLFYYCFGLVGDTFKAEEIVQDAFVKYWDNKCDVRDEYNYLVQVVKNLSLNYLRDNSLRKEKMEDYIDEQFISNLNEQDIIDLLDRIHDSIKTLPPKCQKIFILKCIEGLKYHEIAEDMDVSINTVKTQVKIAYKRLKQELATDATLLFLFYNLFEKNLFF